jgi:Asp-tRNA(Asn)/Glu-tRNA(Gln) amidotransferase A subunit family amidase
MTDACDLTAVEARAAILAGKLSPIELMGSCLKRIADVNPAVNAIVALDPERALAMARDAEAKIAKKEQLGVLAGLPVGIKDLHLTAGYPTTWGSPLFRNAIASTDSGLVTRLKSAGGIAFAMTNVPEFGAGANTKNLVYGATGNPFDTSLTAAGSSGGAAAALATGMAPLATGSDYAGSCRTPAAFCGVVGMRPSPGLCPAPDRLAGLIPWVVLGPMARTVDDMYLLLNAMRGVDYDDPFSSANATTGWPDRLSPRDLKTVTMAFTADFGMAPVARTIRTTFAARLAKIAPTFAQAEQTHPDCTGAHRIFEVHRGLTFVSQHQERLTAHRDRLGPAVIHDTEAGLAMTAAEIGRAFVDQAAFARRFNRFFETYDVLIAPAAAVSPFPHAWPFVADIDGETMSSYLRWLSLAYISTMALCSVVAVPCGRDDKGLPFGIQIIGPQGADRKVLEVAKALETMFAGDSDLARPTPDIAALTRAPAMPRPS